MDINDRQKQAIQFVKQNKYITSALYQDEYSIAKRTAVRDIEELMELHILKKEGSGKNTKYTIDVAGYKT